MKQRETNLKNIVSQLYNTAFKPKLNLDTISKIQYKELMQVYKELGGLLFKPPVNFGPWDIVTENFIIELDEEQHFNRYRLQTLSSSLYSQWPWFDLNAYSNFCVAFEIECLKKAARGGYWSNQSTVNQFGPASLNGVFTENGSPRWKQRAFYDYCKDLFGKVNQTPVYRLSVYETFLYNGKIISLGQALDSNLQDAIKYFLQKKIELV